MKRYMRMTAAPITAVLILLGLSAAHAAPSRLSSIEGVKHPVRVAVDSRGNLYVSETARNKVVIYTSKGLLHKTLSVPGPLGVAVDQSGRIYVGSEGKKSVDIYTPDLTYSHSLGKGKGEFAKPNSIALDGDGMISVVDNLEDTVKVYHPTGAPAFTFGSSGSTDGLFNKPTAIAINDTAGEVYVTDLQIIQTSDGAANGARIQVFDKKGVFKRSFGQYGRNVGEIARPMDIAVDNTGKLYVVDSYQNAVHILDPQTGESLGALYDMTKPLVVPLGVAIAKNSLAYVTSYNGSSIEKYALDGYVAMETAPGSLVFEALQFGPNPAAQSISVTNSGTGTFTWTALADQPWITLGQASADSLPAAVTLAGLAPGVHTGTVAITADFGQTDTIPVTLNVLPPPILGLSNGWLTFTAKKGTNPDPQTVFVGLENVTTLSWSATSNAPWLSITPSGGSTSAETAIAVKTEGMKPGTHQGIVTFHAAGAVGDGSTIMVDLTLTASTKIAVRTNREEAGFTLTGPATYSGSGMSWSAEDAPAGDYTITYSAVSGHKKPAPQTKTLKEGEELEFIAHYASWEELAAKKNIIVAAGPGPKNSARVKTYRPDGTAAGLDIMALESRYGASVASGDVDGDGTAEIIVGAGRGSRNKAIVRIIRTDGMILQEFTPFETRYGVNVAAADLDGDGKAEVMASPGAGPDNTGIVRAYSYDRIRNEMVSTGIEIKAHAYSYGANITAADTEGDGMPELVTAPAGGPGPRHSSSLKIWKLDTTKGTGNWTAAEEKALSLKGRYGATVAAGDTDGDGKDEIIVGAGPDPKAEAEVRIFAADGTELDDFEAFDDSRYGVSVAAADLDGDGRAEIIVGAGPDPRAGKKSSDDDDDDDGDDDGEDEDDGADDDDSDDKKYGNKKRRGMKNKGDHDHYRDHKHNKDTVKVYSATGDLKCSMKPFERKGYGANVAVGDLGL